jgi:hypothetical protein
MGIPSLNSQNSDFNNLSNDHNRQIANIEAVLDISNHAQKYSGAIYDLFDGTNDLSSGVLDTTATTITSAYNAGVSTVAVASITGFVVGQEITIYDDINSEDKIIQSIGVLQLTFTTTTANAYKLGAGVARSNVNISGNKMGFSNLVISSNITTPTNLITGVTGATTSYNNSRKLVRGTDGALYACFYYTNSISYIKVMKSIDNGSTWINLNFPTDNSLHRRFPTITIDSSNNLHLVWDNGSGVDVYYCKYNSSSSSWDTVTNLSGNSNTALYNNYSPTIIADSSNNIYVFWYGTDATYTTTNIKYVIKYNDSYWSGINYVTTGNTYNYGLVSCAVDLLNNIHIVWKGADATYPGATNIKYCKYNGVSWGTITNITTGNVYTQTNPCITIDILNNIHVVWNGLDIIDNNIDNIRYKKYNGSWGAAIKFTSGNTYAQIQPSVATNINNEVHIAWYGRDSTDTTINNIRYIKINSDSSYGAAIKLTSGNVNYNEYPSLCNNYANFTNPIMIWAAASGTIKYMGTFTVSTTSLLSGTARYNITPPLTTTQEFTGWIQKERTTTDSDFIVSTATSIVANGANENYIDMTQTITNYDSNSAEIACTMTPAATAQSDVNFKIKLTRANSSIVKGVTKFLGAMD